MPCVRMVNEDVGDSAHNLPILQNGTAAHPLYDSLSMLISDFRLSLEAKNAISCKNLSFTRRLFTFIIILAMI